MKYSRLLKMASRLIGIVIFIYILMGIDIQSLLVTSFSIHPFMTLILILMVIPIMGLRGVRWQVVAEGLDLNLKALESTEALCMAQLANLIIPGNFGDLIRIPYMKHRGNQVDKSIISILLDSILGAVVPFTFGILAIAILLEFSITIELIIIGAIWVTGGYGFYRIIRASLWTKFMQARRNRLMKEGIRGRAFFTLPSMLKSIGSIRITLSLTLALLLFVIYVTQAYILAYALGISIEWMYLAFTLGIVTIILVIPVTIQGLGLRESVLLFMLTRLAINPVLIISFSLTLMMINLTPAIAGFIIWFRNPFVEITEEEILDTEIDLNLDKGLNEGI
ncbi:MAG: lysylphosphatidylglycerol synthase transmembrane domain-containing protein [Candidatus Sifarchaeia archaeon]